MKAFLCGRTRIQPPKLSDMALCFNILHCIVYIYSLQGSCVKIATIITCDIVGVGRHLENTYVHDLLWLRFKHNINETFMLQSIFMDNLT